MMKIHTTQDLNSLVQLNQLSTNKNVSSRDFRLKNYSEQMLMPKLSAEKVSDMSMSVTFGKKGVRDTKKFIDAVKKGVGEIKKDPQPEKKKGDGLLTSSFFNTTLKIVEFETVVTAIVAAIACAGRAGTIMALPTKKNKEDNRYAASHAVASGIIGFITAFVLTAPFKVGSNYVMKNMKQHLSEKTLERLWPQIDKKSIYDANGKRKPISEWLDRKKNAFCDEMKRCAQLPELRNLAEVSEKTFNRLLIKDKPVDWAAQKDKSFNDVILKDGSKLYDKIDMSYLGITVKEDCMNDAQIMLKDLDKSYLESLVKDAKEQESHWGDLDIKSVYDKNGEVVDFRLWKDTKGNQWKLDLDEIGVSSPYETADYKPRISGRKRYDEKEHIYKFSSYQDNGKNGKLGTEIEDDMVAADLANDGLFKLLTWGPDLLFRIPVAISTIALIPWILKNVFRVQKSSAKQKDAQEAVKQNTEINQNKVNSENKPKAISFKGKTPAPIKEKGYIRKAFDKFVAKFGEMFGKPFGKYYGKRLIESERVYNVSKWISKLPGKVTQHMTAFGSLITSGVYMQQTLTKKDLNPDRRRTLAINQGLCFVVPTALAYTVDKFLDNWVKRRGYRFSGLNQRKIDIAKLEKTKTDKEIEAIVKDLGGKSKGIRTLASITIFALIYRYLTPVGMTPIANKFGDWINKRTAAKKAQQLQQDVEQQTAKEIPLENDALKSGTAKEIKLNNEEEKRVA